MARQRGSALIASAVMSFTLMIGALTLLYFFLQHNSDDTSVLPLPFVNSGGQRVILRSGQPIVIEVFANWCEFSAYEARYVLPDFSRYVRAHGGLIVGVDETNRLGIGQPGPIGNPAGGKDGRDVPTLPHTQEAFLATLQTYAQEFQLPLPLLYDPQGLLAKRLHFYLGPSLAYPTFVFLAADGQFATRAEGVEPLADLVTTYDEVASRPPSGTGGVASGR
jgi:thiol-disulfide isomerase/thioredoxin